VRAADYDSPTHSKTGSLRSKTTTTNNEEEKRLKDSNTKSAYVHPLSQIILEHLQQSRSDWVSQVGLDKGGLTLHKDGTFVLKFPTSGGREISGDAISTDKIWTTFEPKEKKHWLVVQRRGAVGQYMLQDNAKPAWHGSKLSTHERVKAAVDEMISTLETGVNK